MIMWEGLTHEGCPANCRACFVVEQTRKYIDYHVAAERERCARIAEEHIGGGFVASLIRVPFSHFPKSNQEGK